MSILADAPSQNLRHVEILKEVANRKVAKTEWVVIAHGDQEMKQRVSQVLDPGSCALLEIPQSSWDFKSEQMATALEEAINESGAKNVLFVGHSSACDDPTDLSRPRELGKNLLADLQSVKKSTQEAKEHFTEQIESVLQTLDSGRVQIHGLFYLAHGKAFLVYLPGARAFRPLA